MKFNTSLIVAVAIFVITSTASKDTRKDIFLARRAHPRALAIAVPSTKSEPIEPVQFEFDNQDYEHLIKQQQKIRKLHEELVQMILDLAEEFGTAADAETEVERRGHVDKETIQMYHDRLIHDLLQLQEKGDKEASKHASRLEKRDVADEEAI
ncbi:hypothetical protein EJ02DRAFT_512131 [Clathrospora elynae]|uniref:Uncharacterized protein n=1 Tax=Clathrospora elynae TaxID=706981 RepID=A0A6A5SME7_9PLEO|nr:hypothetical protein EJ02DRAFT_512131 [Clathrospora elynae]